MPTEFRVAVPDEEIESRLSDLADVSVVRWRPDEGMAPAEIDLLVLPYMVGHTYLSHLEEAPVRVVQSQMLGYEGAEEHLPSGMIYCNAVGVHELSTAELAAALILSCERGLPGFWDAQRESRWDHRRSRGLAGARVAIVGVGGVGERIGDVLAPFGVSIVQVARRARQNRHGEVLAWDALHETLPAADIVVLAVPLTPETRGMVDEAFLARMKDDALLVNISRGPIVDTDALLRELQKGRLRAALDVTDPEPLPPEHPLWSAPGVMISPHVGGNTTARVSRIDKLVREQVRRMLSGEPPINVVVDARSRG